MVITSSWFNCRADGDCGWFVGGFVVTCSFSLVVDSESEVSLLTTARVSGSIFRKGSRGTRSSMGR